jgi:hypothetical protein
MPDETCDPCSLPSDSKDNLNPTGFVEPNTPVGESDGSLPVNPPVDPPGPTNPGIGVDDSNSDYSDGYPQLDMGNFRQWCQQVPSFKMIQGMIATILANHFADVRNIKNPFLKQYIWTSDPTTSNLIINVEEDWEPNITNRKPAIFIKRNEATIQKVAINDMEQSGRIDNVNEYAVHFVGSHSVRCYGANSQPPDDLAFEVATLMTRVAPAFRNFLPITQFRVTTIGAKDRDDSDPAEAYSVTITIPWGFWYLFKVTRNAPLLQFIDLAFFQ